MPKVTINGKVKHFPYTKAGKKAAKKAKYMMADGGKLKKK